MVFGLSFVSKAVVLSPSTVENTECRCSFELWWSCASSKGNIWHSVKWQHFDDAVPRHNGLSHSPQQGWYYKRYHQYTNSCLSRPNSTVIISIMADSHIQYIIFTTHISLWSWSHWFGDHYVNVLLLQSIQPSAFFWSQQLHSSSGTPSPLRPARTYDQLYRCLTHLTVILLSFLEEISFKISYFLVNMPPFFNEAHVPCHLGHTSKSVCVCVWMVNGVRPGDFKSHTVQN